MAAPDFWNNRERAQTDVDEVSRLRSLINPFHELEREIEDFDALHQLAAEEKNESHRAQADRELSPYRHKMPAPQIDQLQKQYVDRKSVV